MSEPNVEVNGHTALDLVKPVSCLFLDFPLSSNIQVTTEAFLTVRLSLIIHPH